MKTDIEVLDETIELISGDGAWCQGSFCKDAYGTPVFYDYAGFKSQPVSFCLEGALGYTSGHFLNCFDREKKRQWNRLVLLLADQVGSRPRYFNDDDHTTQEDAVLVLKQVRGRLEDGLA